MNEELIYNNLPTIKEEIHRFDLKGTGNPNPKSVLLNPKVYPELGEVYGLKVRHKEEVPENELWIVPSEAYFKNGKWQHIKIIKLK